MTPSAEARSYTYRNIPGFMEAAIPAILCFIFFGAAAMYALAASRGGANSMSIVPAIASLIAFVPAHYNVRRFLKEKITIEDEVITWFDHLGTKRVSVPLAVVGPPHPIDFSLMPTMVIPTPHGNIRYLVSRLNDERDLESRIYTAIEAQRKLANRPTPPPTA